MRRIGLLALAVALAVGATAAGWAQAPKLPPKPAESANARILAGKWTYRSFNNVTALVGNDAQKALDLIFAEAIFTFEIPTSTTLKGTIDWPGGGLDLTGTIENGPSGLGPIVKIAGKGRPGTQTDGWEYDYYGEVAHTWPNGVKQVPAIVGTVIRARPHNGQPAGYTASFVALKQ